MARMSTGVHGRTVFQVLKNFVVSGSVFWGWKDAQVELVSIISHCYGYGIRKCVFMV